MNLDRFKKYYRMIWVLICTCLLLVSSGLPIALNMTATAARDGTNQTKKGSISIQLPGHNNTTLTVIPTSGTNTPGSAPGLVPAGRGSIPAAFPHYFSFGVLSQTYFAPLLDAMRSQNGTAFAFRYQYLSGGVNTNRGWETWSQPPGQYATTYMQENAQHGYTPAFAYYEICQSDGPSPGDHCTGQDNQRDPANLAIPATMKAYYANWVLLMHRIKVYGKPVLVVVEPDMWGFLQMAAHGTDNAANVPASVSSSGYPDAAGFPNTVQGFAWALLHMRDKYAPNATLAIHASCWATSTDIASDTRPSLDVAGLARREAKFLNSAGLYGNPLGVSRWDLLSNDVANHDSAGPAGVWWDRYNHTFPNFARYLNFIGLLSQDTHRRIVMWQVPMGNQYFDTMKDSPGHYQDNRAEYILGNVASFAAAGIIAVLFGPVTGYTMNIDQMNDGITNAAPISTYECNLCNNHTSKYSDDDGGYLRIFVGQYMGHPVPIS